MTTRMRTGVRRFVAGAALAVLAVPLAIVGASPALADPLTDPVIEPLAVTDERTATSGSLDWGVRTSIRNYLEQHDHTEGWVAAYDGASYTRGAAAASFPLKDGVVNPTAGTATLSFGGSLEMTGFGSSWLYFEDIKLSVAGGTATLTVDLIESYNVKTRTDNIVLATFKVPAGGLAITDNKLSLTTERGRFSEAIALDHLPSYGGPTYAAPNDYTDPMQLQLDFGAGGTNPDPGTDPGKQPATGPYGVSAGKAYADSSATIRVTPGYAINAAGETKLKVEGFGFDPGTAALPNNIYVGLGTMKDQTDPEKWRRSKGGSSGPVGLADFTYGSTRLVVSHHSADADVADGVIGANGYWTFDLTVPSKDVPSFFGGTIDCVANACGFFSFGAHGAVRAANEAYTPVFFDGQDESGWPSRGNDDDDDDDNPTEVPPIEGGETGETGKGCVPNGSTMRGISSGAKLEVTPAYCLGEKEQKVTVQGTGYPTSNKGKTSGGIYVLFGWVDSENPNWAPSKRDGKSGSGETYMIAPGMDTHQKGVGFFGGKADDPSMPLMDEKGNWKVELPIASAKFTSMSGGEVDCFKVTCGVFTVGAHGTALAGGEVFTPVYFTETAAGTGTAKPDTGTGTTGPTANPNVQQPVATGAQGSGAAVNGGLSLAAAGSEQGRGYLFGGVLLLSVGLLAMAVVSLRRPQANAIPPTNHH